MNEQKICFLASEQLGISIPEQIALFKRVGIDGFFVRWNEHTALYKECADRNGMIFHSIHAPNKLTGWLWENSPETRELVDEWIRCIDDCADHGIPIVVLHPFQGIDKIGKPNPLGIENFKPVIAAAAKRNVKIAVENCEGEEYFTALMDAFRDCEHVGFCWDSGHEVCYGMSFNPVDRYGDRLICTHLHDNLGITSSNGKIAAKDDMHRLPYDGIIDWEDLAARLKRIGYRDILTFELKKTAYYDHMTAEAYVTEAYARACRVVKMFQP